jgi:hypothetical protein
VQLIRRGDYRGSREAEDHDAWSGQLRGRSSVGRPLLNIAVPTDLVERWFGELTTKKLRRSSHATVKALADDITAWTNTWDTNPTPYRWVKTADAILESIASYCQRTSNSGH